MPQQMIGPATRLPQSVHVGATEEVGLHIHLLNVEFARFDFVVHPLVAGVEATGVTTHRHQAFFFGHAHDFLGVFPAVGQGDFHLHMLASVQASQALCGVHLGGRAQNHSVHFRQGQAVSQIGGDVVDAIFICHFFGFFKITTDQRHHFHAIDIFDAVQMFDAESTCTRQGDFDGFTHVVLLQLWTELKACPAKLFNDVFKNGVAYSGVRGRYMVEAMSHFRQWPHDLPVFHVRHRTTRDQPHHQLNAFATRFTHVVDVRHGSASHGVVDHQVEPVVVPLTVDQARTRALQLVTHATCAPDVHVDVFVVALYRFANRLTKVETTLTTRHGVLHHVDREWNDGARPSALHGVLLAAHQ